MSFEIKSAAYLWNQSLESICDEISLGSETTLERLTQYILSLNAKVKAYEFLVKQHNLEGTFKEIV